MSPDKSVNECIHLPVGHVYRTKKQSDSLQAVTCLVLHGHVRKACTMVTALYGPLGMHQKVR